MPEKYIPTPLMNNHERPPIAITVPASPSTFRGLQISLVLLRLLARLEWWRLTGRFDPRRAGGETRRVLEQLGGLWIKLGQLLSLRVDLFPVEFWTELSRLQDQARGFPGRDAVAIVAKELGGPLERHFSEFDVEPFAAASTAQVHRARLRENGVEVAVKVQRPEIEASVARDMRMIGGVVWLLETFRIAVYLRWDQMHKELQQIITEEVDFRYEASSHRRMARTLKQKRVRVPCVFSAVCTKRVLVTEMMRGVLMSDYIYMLAKDAARLAAWREENDIDPQRVGRRLLFSLLRQIFEDNLYHGDLHPGNIMLFRNNRVALIDLGAVGITDVEFLGRYRLFLRSVGDQDFSKAADALLMLSDGVPVDTVGLLRTELTRCLRNWSLRTHATDLSFNERSISAVSTKLIQILAAGRVTPDWSFLRIRRAEQTLDAAIIHLVPRTNYSKVAHRYFGRADRRRLMRFMTTAPTRLAEGTVAAVEQSERMLEDTLFTASVIRNDALEIEESISHMSWFLRLLLTQSLIALVLIGLIALVVLFHQHPVPGVSKLTERLYPAAFRFPVLSRFWWGFILVADTYLIGLSWRLRARMARDDRRSASPARRSSR